MAIIFAKLTLAQENFYEIIKGKILLQVQSHGEAWYVNPANYRKYYLGLPKDAFDLMRNLGIGITNEDLTKIPVGIIEYDDQDDDNDGLSNNLEQALGTDPQNTDSDNDGHDDKAEIEQNYNPLGGGNLNIDINFTNQHLGKIFLQTQQDGQAWYINPADQKRYFLGRPADAFTIMRKLSLGITNENINKITTGQYTAPQPAPTPPPAPAPPTCPSCRAHSADQVFAAAASAIRSGNKTTAMSYFSENMQKAVEYTMDFLNSEGEFILGNLMSGASLSSSTADERIYTTEVYFSLGGYKVEVSFHVKKQDDGTWKLTNL